MRPDEIAKIMQESLRNSEMKKTLPYAWQSFKLKPNQKIWMNSLINHFAYHISNQLIHEEFLQKKLKKPSLFSRILHFFCNKT